MIERKTDLKQAARFLEILDRTADARSLLEGVADGYTFQTFDDNKKRKASTLASIRHGTLPQCAPYLADLNNQGAGIFVAINETDMRGRGNAHVTRIRAVWIEDDGGASDLLPLTPHLICETSPGKFHSLFLVDGLSPAEHQKVQTALIEQYGSDPQAKDLARVLRVPGFFHCKGKPHRVRLVYASDAPPYRAEIVLAAFSPVEPATVPPTAHEAYTPPRSPETEPGYTPITEADSSSPLPDITLENAASYLPEPGEQDYKTWRDVGMALHHQFAGSYEALLIFDAWSQKVREYLGFNDVAKAWASFGKRAIGPIITFRTLVHAYNKRHPESKRPTNGEATAAVKAQALLEACEDYLSLVQDVAPQLKALANKNVVLEKDFVTALVRRYAELRPNDTLSRGDAVRAMKRSSTNGIPQSEASTDFNNPRTPRWAKDWVWISEEEVFFCTRTRVRLTITGFRGHFDSRLPTGEGAPTDAATWIRKNDLIPKVMRSLYLPRFGRLFNYAGIEYVNTYNDFYRATVPSIVQNHEAVALFKQHLELLCGGWTREAHLFANFLAACTADPPVKVRWAPLIIGANGIGKTLFYTFVATALGMDNAQIINGASIMASASTGQSGWAEGICFTVINEVKWQGHNRYDIVNILKPYITDDMIPVKKMYQEVRQRPNPGNYLLLSNYNDCIPIEVSDRRPFVIRSGLELADLPSGYFDDLHAAIAQHAGDIVCWLRELPTHPEFSIHGAAPMTLDKAHMIQTNVDTLEELIQEALDDNNRPLFTREALCFGALFNYLLVQMGGSLKPDQDMRVGRVLIKLGYVKLGRIRLDGERQRLWAKNCGAKTLSLEQACDLFESRLLKIPSGLSLVEADFESELI